MQTQKYSVNQYQIGAVLSYVKQGEIAIPEIQRPFVWDSSQVRDLMDSLYQGYPIGYLIAWRNPDIKLKDGSKSEGKKILIDGQQRVTALTASILGQYIINKNYKRTRIKISFHPIEEKFEVLNTAIIKDNSWIKDISEIFKDGVSVLKIVKEYCQHNEHADEDKIFTKIETLKKILEKQIGLIELDSHLDIETVTDIFIRINSKGAVLSQADFAMSKIASDEKYNGPELRKCIDYFCHMAISPEFYYQIVELDKEFAKTEFFQKMSWLKNENDDIYDPSYKDLLRVAFTSEFSRGKISDLVSLLSGRNFETRTFEEEIAEKSFENLEKGISNFINETNFKQLVMIIRSAGFIASDLVRSQNTLNFAYILYLKLKLMNYPPDQIIKFVKKWFVFSILNGRYSGSAESRIDFDIKQIDKIGIEEYLKNVESAELSDAFWEASLVQSLNTSVASSPYFNVYLAAQVKSLDKGFLSSDISVADMILNKGDIHHIFPKDYLKKNGLRRGDYNQIANYVYMQTEINIQVGNKAPRDYMATVLDQCNGGKMKYGGIKDKSSLVQNLAMNCIPEAISEMNIDDYQEFLEQRRILMAEKIKKYYYSL